MNKAWRPKMVEFVKEWEGGKNASDDEKLETYALYKQATVAT